MEDWKITDIKADETLDARGLSCPMPVLKTKKAMDNLKSGQILEIFSTDPGTRNDLPADQADRQRIFRGKTRLRFFPLLRQEKVNALFEGFRQLNRLTQEVRVWPKN